ncbi:hypothetical protein KI387_031419, partial [Taxus chinensis]
MKDKSLKVPMGILELPGRVRIPIKEDYSPMQVTFLRKKLYCMQVALFGRKDLSCSGNFGSGRQ